MTPEEELGAMLEDIAAEQANNVGRAARDAAAVRPAPAGPWLRYDDLDAFYDEEADDLGKARRRSPEVDYGVMWRTDGHPWPSTRVSWVEATGELYAYTSAHAGVGRVEVLAVLGCREDVDEALEGWADGTFELDWVRARVGDYPPAGRLAEDRRRMAAGRWVLRRAEIGRNRAAGMAAAADLAEEANRQ